MFAKYSDIVVVGHFSLDSISVPNNSEPHRILGGAVAYVSIVARRLDATAAVISKVGKDFPETYFQSLRAEGVDVSGVTKVKSEQTTSFELTYSQDLSSRTLKLKMHGSPILVDDLPSLLRADVVHVAPIADEVSFELVEYLKAKCKCLSLDPQGMTRLFDKEGNVDCCTQIDKRILPIVDIYKSSLKELKSLTGESDLQKALKAIHELGPEIVITTMGAEGSVLSTRDAVYNVPPCKPKRVVDPTGAGDVFIGAFLVEYNRKKDPLWCACVGSAAASLVVEGIGTSFFGEKDEIYQRARNIYEKK